MHHVSPGLTFGHVTGWALVAALVTGCQTWSTTVFTVPLLREEEVRAAVRTVSAANGLSSCAEWKAEVKGAQECFGGSIKAGAVTVAASVEGANYVVRVGVYSSGRYDRAALEALELQYQHALESLFPVQSIVRTESQALLAVERAASSAEVR